MAIIKIKSGQAGSALVTLRCVARIFAFLLLGPAAAFATCPGSPAGNEGDLIYNSTYHVMQYCNGTVWINMGGATLNGTTNYVTKFTGAFALGNSLLYDNGASVGIGTTSPAYLLDVKTSSSATAAHFYGGSASTPTLIVDDYNNGIGNGGLSIRLAGVENGRYFTSGDMFLDASNSNSLWLRAINDVSIRAGGLSNTVATFKASGSVGIGTTSPAHTLDIEGTLVPLLVNSSNNSNVLALSYANTIGGYLGASGTNMIFSGAAGAEAMRITNNGNLGVGATSPGNTLTVNGTAGFQFGTNYTTTGTSQNDVAINTSSSVRYTGAGVATFNGIVAGQNGQVLYLHNDSSYALTLANLNTSETTYPNQIITGTGASLAVAASSAVTLQYDTTALNGANTYTGAWRVIGGSGGATTPAGTTGQVQYNSGAGTLAATSSLTYSATNNELTIGSSTPATPIGTSGAVASLVVNVIPQASTNTGNSVTGGRVLLNTMTASNSASLADLASITSSYVHYDVVFENVLPVTNADTLNMQFYSGGAYVATGYGWSVLVPTASNYSATGTACQLTYGARVSNTAVSGGFTGMATTINPQSTVYGKNFLGNATYFDSSGTPIFNNTFGCTLQNTSAVTGFKFYFSGGNIASGAIKIYGWN